MTSKISKSWNWLNAQPSANRWVHPQPAGRALMQATLNIIVSHKFLRFFIPYWHFFALLEVFMRDWLSLMQSALTFHFWPFTFFFFFPQGKGCSACITAMLLQPWTLKINTWSSSVKISINLLQVQAFRNNNFPGWDCLFIFWAISTRRELAEVGENRLFHVDTGLEAVSRVAPSKKCSMGFL